MLPTQLLYEAAGRPAVPGLLDLAGWRGLKAGKGRPETPPEGPCYLCGAEVGGLGLPAAQQFRETWTAHDTAAAPGSEWVCPACAFSLSEAAGGPGQAKPFKMRSFSHLVAGERWEVITLAEKGRLRQVLLSQPAGLWLLCICDAPLAARHSLYRTPVNAGPGPWAVTLGGQVVRGTSAALAGLLAALEGLYRWHTKAAIRTGEYAIKLIDDQGAAAWAELESAVAPLRGKPLFELGLFLVQKESPSPNPSLEGGE